MTYAYPLGGETPHADERCPERQPLTGRECGRERGHDGAHVDYHDNYVVGWGWPRTT